MISPMSSERVSGIARYAKEHGWNLMIQDRLGHSSLTWHGDGILATLRSDPVSFRNMEALMKRGIPLVDLTVSRPEVNVPRVVSDHVAIGRLAAKHFVEREFRHVAWFSTAWGNVHRLRYKGLSEACPEAVPCWILQEHGGEKVPDWTGFVTWVGNKLAGMPKPLAVLTYDESDAARLLYAARELDIAVPEELAILSIGNNPLICENQSVPLSSIDQNLDEGGYRAAALLDRIMDKAAGRKRPSSTARDSVLIPPRGIVTRRSTDVVAVADPTVRAALLFIAEHLGEPIGAPQIAEAIGVRRTDLDLRFRSVLDRSVGEEIRRQRLARVKRLLKETDMNIADIAAETGYCTSSHLTNAFKAAFDMTPKAYRGTRRGFPA